SLAPLIYFFNGYISNITNCCWTITIFVKFFYYSSYFPCGDTIGIQLYNHVLEPAITSLIWGNKLLFKLAISVPWNIKIINLTIFSFIRSFVVTVTRIAGVVAFYRILVVL